MRKINLKRRWINARPGSVLILVIALLVLLALIGTAYLSSTQTERYTSQQNTINTEADLLIQGMVSTLNGEIVNGLFGTVNGVSTYRPPASEQPYQATAAASTTVASTGYYDFVTTAVDNNSAAAATDPDPASLFLADRFPIKGAPTWEAISWPLFKDQYGGYSFDSPLDNSISTGIGENRGYFQFAVNTAPGTLKTLADGTVLPTISVSSNGVGGKAFVAPTPTFTAGSIYAADTDGDGIADALFCKVPVGQIDGVTYYVATRVLDGNSAINVSSAFTQGPDDQFGTAQPNYGFFRSNIGLYELLNPGTSVTRDTEMDQLNGYRYGVAFSGTGSLPTSSLAAAGPDYTDPTVSPFAYNNGVSATSVSTPTNFNWYADGDVFENVLTRRPGNPGYASSSAVQSYWFGLTQSARLAYKFALYNSNLTPSVLEQTLLPNELYTNIRSTPYSPSQATQWYNDLFGSLNNYSGSGTNTGPLRTVLTASNAVSNAAPTRLGNSSSATATTWQPNVIYKFGDWVTDGANASSQRSYVCIQQHTSSAANEPGSGVNVPGAVGIWAGVYATAPIAPVIPGVPFSQQVTKTSVNTATFEQLWVAFAQVMTDSVDIDPLNMQSGVNTGNMTGGKQWLPPMQQQAGIVSGSGAEPQLGMFRSVLRTPQPPTLGRSILTPSQMLQLRAAIAAVNTLDLRDSDNDVSSRSIVLTDPASGTAAYKVEVYGTERQPYISELFIQADGTPGVTSANNYIALELCNPYPVPLTLTGWQIGSMSRATAGTPTGMTLTGGVPIPTVTIPPALNGRPGLLILQEGIQPTDVAAQITTNQGTFVGCTTGAPTLVSGLFNAAMGITGNLPDEIFLMRPRLVSGPSSSAGTGDVYNEAYVADNVPVDQMDLTGLTVNTSAGAGPGAPGGGGTPPPTRFTYRRGNDAYTTDATSVGLTVASLAPWHFVYPGYYNPVPSSSGCYFQQIGAAAAAIQTDLTGTAKCFLAGPTFTYGGANSNATYHTLPIVLNNTNMAGPNPTGAAGNVFPFGQFARQADMLQIPFIGSYRIQPANTPDGSQQVTELNSVTIDSALAYDNSISAYALSTAGAQPDAANGATKPSTVFIEQIGRFCPVGDPSSADPARQLDFGTGYAPSAGAGSQQKVYWHYHWAKRLFDYLTVQSPQDDYFPNVDPAQANGGIQAKYPDVLGTTTPPVPVANNSTNKATSNVQTAGTSEDTVGVEGLININTAPVAVIAQLPLPQSSNGVTNYQIAQAIVNYRVTNGPFHSIYDLYLVPAFFSASQNPISPYPVGPSLGVFSPYGLGTGIPPATTAVPMDFLQEYYALNNISNLITTRSDTFTCYILLQGWRNVGGSNPTLAVQRRAAYILDRNGITPSNNVPLIYKFPTD